MPSSVASHTIPSFYACYFLRSLSSPGITYIGSTPAPPRRKRQHNGDLTQGAWKTARSRPWEMECIVYGFSSKIAALQFEWAWAKPHLSRHLKFLATECSAFGTRTDTSSLVGMPLFPSTSMTPGQTKWGKPKRRIARAPASPNARLLAMRALLRSEPFCGWGLKLAFFTEWSWLAYQRLERQALADNASGSDAILQPLLRFSRSGKPLHPMYPVALCDFSGVDGKRVPLVHVSAEHRAGAGVTAEPVKKRASSAKAAVAMNSEGGWPETLPKGATLKSLDACIQDFAEFPMPPTPLESTDLTVKAKRATKAGKGKATEEDEQDSDLAEELENGTGAGAAPIEGPMAEDRILHRMRFVDLDAEEAEWSHFEASLSVHLATTSGASAGEAASDYMQTCVQRHIAAQDARTISDALPAPTAPCALCREPIDLTRHLDFALCPHPTSSTAPVVSTTATLPSCGESERCNSVYHLSCLANSFLERQSAVASQDADAASSRNTVLPTHGICPCHPSERSNGEDGGANSVTLWADVVRGMYRRSERFERLLQLLVRSGRTLTDLRNPQTVAKPTRAKKGAKASEDTAAGEAEQTGKKRKPRKPATQAVDAGAAEAPPTEKAARKKPSRKKAVPAVDVIDLT
ncbi:uncharacterized protein PAN0_003c1923 [Moesziomyces antarcticus]|uniref:Related to Structure-specific endonuclease subunit SLX1 n=1 Tax=Pseudozyma antarctica TaxID=84753 RepID=A0A5C3FIV6_PSEA2|nr:uncharacterized protein PAN0_003c1923 [Moesziomyces antarcticus]GAK63716.1 conserved hypothetical protein [Moesziomyces antarcticus]SPO44313.1 related to Structure-specific endonuclease subunit SLX1 [Moesziomyces antarcticus]